MGARNTRRRFLKTAAFAAAGCWILEDARSAASYQANEKLNIAMIACGGRGLANMNGDGGSRRERNNEAAGSPSPPTGIPAENITVLCDGCLMVLFCFTALADHPFAAAKVTSLTNPEVRYEVPAAHFVVLERGDVRAVVVDNADVDVPELRGHRSGYNGVASLTHRRRAANLFVPNYAGLNFEHIHDGTAAGLKEKFEPRKFPMQLRRVDAHTVELYQPPTGNWKLESCGRYRLLEDGTVEYTFECIPRAGGYQRSCIGLFWASYIHQPEQTTIFFRGQRRDEDSPPRWIASRSPQHGTDSTHGPAAFPSLLAVDADFPLTLVNHPSPYVYTEPWYYGVSHGMAFVQMFRERDRIWLAQSPSGGGTGNPAWDFQWFIPDFQIGQAYGFVMRAAYLPYDSPEQIEQVTRQHRVALQAGTGK